MRGHHGSGPHACTVGEWVLSSWCGPHFSTPSLLCPIESGRCSSPTKGRGCSVRCLPRDPQASSPQRPGAPVPSWGQWGPALIPSWQRVGQLRSDTGSERQDQSPPAPLLSRVALGSSLSVPEPLEDCSETGGARGAGAPPGSHVGTSRRHSHVRGPRRPLSPCLPCPRISVVAPPGWLLTGKPALASLPRPAGVPACPHGVAPLFGCCWGFAHPHPQNVLSWSLQASWFSLRSQPRGNSSGGLPASK